MRVSECPLSSLPLGDDIVNGMIRYIDMDRFYWDVYEGVRRVSSRRRMRLGIKWYVDGYRSSWSPPFRGMRVLRWALEERGWELNQGGRLCVGDYVEDCRYHVCRVESVDYEGDDLGVVSIFDGSRSSCSMRHCGIRKLRVHEVQVMRMWYRAGGICRVESGSVSRFGRIRGIR